MKSGVDIAIMGGGVQGLTLGYFLAKAGRSVEIVERGSCGKEATWAGAGIIPPGGASAGASPADRLRTLSSSLFPGLSAELLSLTGIDNGFRHCGAWHLPEVGLDLLPFRQLCKREELRLEEPGTGRAWPGNPALVPLFLPGTMQVRNPRHARALRAACLIKGASIREDTPVLSIKTKAGRVVSIETPSGSLEADWFVLAAGAWSGGLASQLGINLPVRPIRGVISLLEMTGPRLDAIIEQGKKYVVPRGDGLFLVGSSEQDAGFDKTVETPIVEELEAWACWAYPELESARRKAVWAGLRPGSPDGLPFLGACPGLENLVLATGHYRAGLQLSPGTAHLLTDWFMKKNPSIPLEPFSPNRPHGPLAGGFLN